MLILRLHREDLRALFDEQADLLIRGTCKILMDLDRPDKKPTVPDEADIRRKLADVSLVSGRTPWHAVTVETKSSRTASYCLGASEAPLISAIDSLKLLPMRGRRKLG